MTVRPPGRDTKHPSRSDTPNPSVPIVDMDADMLDVEGELEAQRAALTPTAEDPASLTRDEAEGAAALRAIDDPGNEAAIERLREHPTR